MARTTLTDSHRFGQHDMGDCRQPVAEMRGAGSRPVAAAAARRAGIDRVAIDVDAHHGNGTEAIFHTDPTVLTISLPEDRMFALETGGAGNRGAGAGRGANVDLPLPLSTLGLNAGGYAAVTERLVEAAERHCDGRLIALGRGLQPRLLAVLLAGDA